MLHVLRTFTAVLTAVLLISATACDAGGSASCKETCSIDDDCQSGLACFSTNSGRICLPSGCGACFSDGRTCQYNENFAEQANGEPRECTFSQCGF